MEDPQRPGRPSRGSGLAMLLLLVLVLAIFAGWAFLRNPSGTPAPTVAASPTDGTSGQSNRNPQ
jgi:hypothetical protein